MLERTDYHIKPMRIHEVTPIDGQHRIRWRCSLCKFVTALYVSSEDLVRIDMSERRCTNPLCPSNRR